MVAAVDDGGALCALEMATGYGDDPSRIGLGTGRIVRQIGSGMAEVVVTGLSVPSAVDSGPDGALFVAAPAFGADDVEGIVPRCDLSGGEPIRVPEEVPVPSCA